MMRSFVQPISYLLRKPAAYFSFGVLACAAVIGCLSFDRGNDDRETTNVRPDGRLQYKWYAPQLPESISFAGEKAPLDRWEVREALDRELLSNYYDQFSLLYVLKLSGRYFPMIEEVLEANGIPDDFKYLCVAESHLQNQTSRAGACGFWQFMPATAPRYGLEVSDDVDERFHVLKATDAACKYFIEAKNKLGSWTAAAASYNCGMGGYSNFSSQQQATNFYDLIFYDETNRYIYRILALKYLVSGAQQMGYIVKNSDAYSPVRTRTVTVSASIPNLANWVIENGSSYKMLKTLNPWLRAKSLSVKPGKTYQIELPK